MSESLRTVDMCQRDCFEDDGGQYAQMAVSVPEIWTFPIESLVHNSGSTLVCAEYGYP
jgi:hypothetical protein